MTDAPNLEAQELELRIEKLRCEVDELKRNSAWNRRVGQWIPLVSTLLPALALVFAIRQFTAEQEASRQQVIRAAAAEKVADERAFMRTVLDLQLSTYYDAAGAVGTLAGNPSDPERRKAVDTFWKLYWGPMAMFESPEVASQMVAVGNCLNHTRDCTDGDLRNASLTLATTLRHHYVAASRQTPEQYANIGAGYNRQP